MDPAAADQVVKMPAHARWWVRTLDRVAGFCENPRLDSLSTQEKASVIQSTRRVLAALSDPAATNDGDTKEEAT